MQVCFENADQAERLARAIRSSRVVSLLLGLRNGIPLEPFVPPLLELAKGFPEFDFRVHRGLQTNLESDLRDDKIEILLGPKPDEHWVRFEHWPLFTST